MKMILGRNTFQVFKIFPSSLPGPCRIGFIMKKRNHNLFINLQTCDMLIALQSYTG